MKTHSQSGADHHGLPDSSGKDQLGHPDRSGTDHTGQPDLATPGPSTNREFISTPSPHFDGYNNTDGTTVAVIDGTVGVIDAIAGSSVGFPERAAILYLCEFPDDIASVVSSLGGIHLLSQANPQRSEGELFANDNLFSTVVHTASDFPESVYRLCHTQNTLCMLHLLCIACYDLPHPSAFHPCGISCSPIPRHGVCIGIGETDGDQTSVHLRNIAVSISKAPFPCTSTSSPKPSQTSTVPTQTPTSPSSTPTANTDEVSPSSEPSHQQELTNQIIVNNCCANIT
jgi:hypothetical protein